MHWASPKLPWGMQRICGPFVLKTIIVPSKRIFVLWHSLISSLYFIQVYIFIPLIHSAPFLHFSHILLYTNFFLRILPREDAVARNLIIVYNFSSQRPHLNYLFLSNVYSFDTIEFSMKHKYLLAHIYQQSFKPCCYCLIIKSESLQCAKVVVLKLCAIVFYSGDRKSVV